MRISVLTTPLPPNLVSRGWPHWGHMENGQKSGMSQWQNGHEVMSFCIRRPFKTVPRLDGIWLKVVTGIAGGAAIYDVPGRIRMLAGTESDVPIG